MNSLSIRSLSTLLNHTTNSWTDLKAPNLRLNGAYCTPAIDICFLLPSCGCVFSHLDISSLSSFFLFNSIPAHFIHFHLHHLILLLPYFLASQRLPAHFRSFLDLASHHRNGCIRLIQAPWWPVRLFYWSLSNLTSRTSRIYPPLKYDSYQLIDYCRENL